MGFRGPISRNTLANAKRNWRIYADVAQVLIRQARPLYANLRLGFLTNNFQLPALTIAQLYKRRWDVELFFKWIKQHLRIKKFYGTSPNAVKTQIWVAMIVYLLLAILRKQHGVEAGFYRILQILSVTVFEKTPILPVLEGLDPQLPPPTLSNQLTLFDL